MLLPLRLQESCQVGFPYRGCLTRDLKSFQPCTLINENTHFTEHFRYRQCKENAIFFFLLHSLQLVVAVYCFAPISALKEISIHRRKVSFVNVLLICSFFIMHSIAELLYLCFIIIYYLYCYICGFWLYSCIKFPSRGMQLSACVYGGPPDSPVIGVYVQQVAIYIYIKYLEKSILALRPFCDLNLNF